MKYPTKSGWFYPPKSCERYERDIVTGIEADIACGAEFAALQGEARLEESEGAQLS